MRYLLLGLIVATGAYLHTAYALALGRDDVSGVVEVLEELSPARGEAIYYDDDAAADWYEFDQEESSIIPDAGFSPETWRDAYDKTLKGLIALIPDAEFSAIENGVIERAGSAEDSAEFLGRLRALRGEGRAYVDVVRPFHGRLRELSTF